MNISQKDLKLTFDIKAFSNRTKDPVDFDMKLAGNKKEIGWILENKNRACSYLKKELHTSENRKLQILFMFEMEISDNMQGSCS